MIVTGPARCTRTRLRTWILAGALATTCAWAPAHAETPCRRAHHLAGGQPAPCALEGLPAATLDALLAQQDLARRLAVTLDEHDARADAADRACATKAGTAAHAHAAELAAVEQAGAARLAAADVHVAALERQVRALTRPGPTHWTLPRVLGVVLAAGVAVAAGVPCARGDAGWCAVSGAGVGVGVGVAW